MNFTYIWGANQNFRELEAWKLLPQKKKLIEKWDSLFLLWNNFKKMWNIWWNKRMLGKVRQTDWLICINSLNIWVVSYTGHLKNFTCYIS